jgi:hypothetical protein
MKKEDDETNQSEIRREKEGDKDLKEVREKTLRNRKEKN